MPWSLTAGGRTRNRRNTEPHERRLPVNAITMAITSMIGAAKFVLKHLPYVKRLHNEIGELKAELKKWRTWKPPGHFYSPIPALDEVRADAARIFRDSATPPSGVALNEDRQIELLKCLSKYHAELPEEWKSKGRSRYCYGNSYYSWADAIVLYCMLRHLAPQRIVEVGSGFSSAAVLDTNEMFLENSVQCSFVEPYPQRLLDLLRPGDVAKCSILQRNVQSVAMEVFTSLGSGDILLIDSSHVSKTGSDVNWLVFEVLPALALGYMSTSTMSSTRLSILNPGSRRGSHGMKLICCVHFCNTTLRSRFNSSLPISSSAIRKHSQPSFHSR